MQTGINFESDIVNLTRETLKKEIDKIDEIYLDILYKVISAFKPTEKLPQDNWQEFVNTTYGSFIDEPLERPNQGEYEKRELFE